MEKTVLSCSYFGVESYVVEVEVDVSNGLPIFNIVGMGDLAILESKERIRSCFKNIGIDFPIKRILVNLSPADIKKKGSHFDLPILIGILSNIGEIKNVEKLKEYLILGEISLNGKIKGVKGVINATILAKEKGIRGVIVPFENYGEAKLISGVEIVPIKEIKDAVHFFNNKLTLEILISEYEKEYKNIKYKMKKEKKEIDFSEIKGQFLAKRAMEICAAGGHNIFLIGDPGSGKSMISKRFNTILPDMTEEEIIETTKIYSISGLLSRETPIISNRPFRAPHHTSTQTALVGGALRAGEITLALNGVLFLDELGEFGIKTLETLRQPLEDGQITISRANSIITYPVKNITIMASNPSPSGFFPGDPQCVDSLRDIKLYQKRFSGPLLDRVDLYVEMRRLTKEEIFDGIEGEKSEEIKKRVENARKIQYKRYKKNILNSQIKGKEIKKYCKLDGESKKILEEALDNLKLSMRMYDKILKVARTIADLENKENIEKQHILEALIYQKK